MTTELPIITSCEGCGACCLQQESPPMYLFILSGNWPVDEDDPDTIRARNLPPELAAELKAYRELLAAGKPHPRGGICLWYDEQTRGCKHYELRPEICREFEMNSPECHDWRKEYDIR